MVRRDRVILFLSLSCTVGLAAVAVAQPYGASFATFAPTGPRTLVGSVEPALRKWYVSQELYLQYGWDQWQYTNYARTLYERYVDITLEGTRHYDVYGNYITRGWEIYRWEDNQPRDLGSSILKNPRYKSWFNNVLISSTSKGQYFTALTVGDAIRTTLTPLTFSTPAFNGIQWDFSADKYQLTAIASRLNSPGTAREKDENPPQNVTDYMGLLGFRGTVQLGDFATVGGTYVGARIGRSIDDFVSGSFKGQLSSDQNAGKVLYIKIKISDDSPEDGETGGMLFDEHISIDGEERDLGPGNPKISGGIRREGRFEANGSDEIILTYDLSEFSYTDERGRVRTKDLFQRISFALVLANDYHVEVTSNRQLDLRGQEIFLPVAQAEGNVKDATNQAVVRFDYGLPTGNEIFGATLDLTDVFGFSLKGEWDISRRNKRFPNNNPEIKEHFLSSTTSPAFYVTIAKRYYPWYGYVEAFNMDPDYSTTVFMPTTAGRVFYHDPLNWFEFVDNNDDQDRFPDWKRSPESQMTGNELDKLAGTLGSGIFPGLDENNDYISDFNQNQNFQPDYVEPFLRYSVDPPEFLFGVDMNNNTVIERFEADDQPDYPYRRDHRGYNTYIGAEVVRGLKLTVGHSWQRLISAEQESRLTYGMLTFDKSFAGVGDLRVFQHTRIVHDNVPEDLTIWEQLPGSFGSNRPFPDPMVAPNTLVSTSYADFSYIGIPQSTLINKVKYEIYHQREPQQALNENARFVGVINKIDHTVRSGKMVVTPRFKSIYWRQIPFRKGEIETHLYSALGSLLLNYQAFASAGFQFGYEIAKVFDLVDRGGDKRADQGFLENVYGVQFSNTTAYLGYPLTATLGFRAQIQKSGKGDFKTTKTGTVTFVKIYAGIEK